MLWHVVIERYVGYVQVPTWQAQALRPDGSPSPTYMSPDIAALLRSNLFRVIEIVAARRRVLVSQCTVPVEDLEILVGLQGRTVPRSDRCSKKHLDSFQTAFLLNRDCYRCKYCGRTALDVYAEDIGQEQARTLRLELDQRKSKQQIADLDRFDPRNLDVACRSCNTIRGVMEVARLRLELKSWGVAIVRNTDG